MTKWALFAAHRYVWAGAAAPRAIGPNGRPLRRPWRMRSEQVVREAIRRRATRPQPLWPRVLGWTCIGVAILAALMPMGPVPRHVQVSASSRPVPESLPSGNNLAAVAFVAAKREFCWQSANCDPPLSLVLLAADYRELGRVAGAGKTAWQLPDSLRDAVQSGETYHCYVLAKQSGKLTKSPLLTLEWP